MLDSGVDGNLFSKRERAYLHAVAPLAVRMRPRTIEEFVGQRHFMGRDKLLVRMLRAERLSSVIFHGPPGVGKTSLARVIANHTNASFHALSAPSSTVAEIRQVIAAAKDRLARDGSRTVLFLDEIHRFSRSQQDVLLEDVESGILILIGATTENPYFSVNSPLISRSTVFRFESLNREDLLQLLQMAMADKERGLGAKAIEVDSGVLEYIAALCDGDARKALTALEVGVLSQERGSGEARIRLTMDVAKESIQEKAIYYNGTGDTHYDLASAFQKSMRGSDPDATVYWLARMLAGGEDTRFVARRIAVCAAEDVGNADPLALVLAAAAVQVAEFVGLPEAQLALAQAALYVACAPKSNACSAAICAAAGEVKAGPVRDVPRHLKDSHYAAAKKEGIGRDYKDPHHYPDGFVPQQYLPPPTHRYYKPTGRGHEKTILQYLQGLQRVIEEGRVPDRAGIKED